MADQEERVRHRQRAALNAPPSLRDLKDWLRRQPSLTLLTVRGSSSHKKHVVARAEGDMVSTLCGRRWHGRESTQQGHLQWALFKPPASLCDTCNLALGKVEPDRLRDLHVSVATELELFTPRSGVDPRHAAIWEADDQHWESLG